MQDENPFNSMPIVIVMLALAAFAVELMFSAAAAGILGGATGIGWRFAAVQDYAVVPAALDLIVTGQDTSVAVLKRFVVYPFFHGSFTSAIFGCVFLLALGKFVGDIFNPIATVFLFFLCAVVGAIVYAMTVSSQYPLIGLYPPVYGLIGAYTYIIWLRLGQMGDNQLKAFRLIGFLLGIQLVFGLLFGSSPVWIAELTGFFTGFAASTVLAPGGWTALLARMRQRSG